MSKFKSTVIRKPKIELPYAVPFFDDPDHLIDSDEAHLLIQSIVEKIIDDVPSCVMEERGESTPPATTGRYKARALIEISNALHQILLKNDRKLSTITKRIANDQGTDTVFNHTRNSRINDAQELKDVIDTLKTVNAVDLKNDTRMLDLSTRLIEHFPLDIRRDYSL